MPENISLSMIVIQNIMLFEAFSSPLHFARNFKIYKLISKELSCCMAIKKCPPPILAVVLMLFD
jgi:hypothetical protein